MDRQKIFDWALKTFLFLSPVFFFRQFQLSFARGLFFILGTFALFGISLGCEQKRKFSNIWISLFLLLAFVRMFFNNDFGNPQAEWFNFWLACAGFIYVFCGVLLFYIVYCYADKVETYLKPIIAVCILNAILVSVQLMNKDFMWQHAPSICGFMENSSQLGQYSALALPIISYLNPFLVIFPLFTLFASKSVSPILAAGIGMMIFYALKPIRGKVMPLIGILLIVIGLFNFNYISRKFQCRPIMWQKTLKVALQRPYLGWGYGSFREQVTENKVKGTLGRTEFSRAHNDYLHTGQELGVPIVIIIFMYLIGLWKRFKIKKEKTKLTYLLATTVLIGLVNMGGQTFCRYASVMSTWIVLLALLEIKLADHQI